MKKIITIMIRILNSIFPKNPKYIYCRSTFLYPDNIDAVIKELLKSNKDFTIFCEEPTVVFTDNRIICVKSKLQSLFSYLRSKYVFWDTGMFGNPKPTKNQITINLWHGVSFKKIGYYLDTKNTPRPTSTYVVTYSDLFVEIMSKAFGVEKKHVLTTGEPRNDYLFNPVNDETLKLMGIKKTDGKKLVIWMPTYRQSRYEDFSDGKKYDIGFPIIDANLLPQLNKVCEEFNIILVLKWHALQVLPKETNEIELNNIIFLTSEQLNQYSVPLNSFLARCDALITDYSSVFINYMLLDRPIGFAYDDIEEYKKNRGFMFENIEQYMPGFKIQNFDLLVKFLNDVSKGVDLFSDKRKEMRKVLNKHYDNKNAQRLLKTIGII